MKKMLVKIELSNTYIYVNVLLIYNLFIPHVTPYIYLAIDKFHDLVQESAKNLSVIFSAGYKARF